jgi:ribosomal protein L35AE/L33A
MPLTAFSSLPLSFELKKEKFNNSEISLDYDKQYNKTDDRIKLNYCDLAISKIDLNNSFIEINKSGDCLEKVHLIAKNEKDLVILNTYLDNNTNTYYFTDLPLSNVYKFFIYQDNTLDRDYSNNKAILNYEVLKLIDINFEEENILLYSQNEIKFNVKCGKSVDLEMDLNCGIFNKTETFTCDSNGKEFSYSITPFDRFKCSLEIKNDDLNVDIKKELNFKFEFPKALEKFELGSSAITIFEINGEEKALVGNELKDINIVNVDKDNFQSSLTGMDGALNIYNVELPDYLKFVKVEAEQPVKVDEKGNKITIKTFASEVKIITKSLEVLNESEKEKYGVKEEADVVKNNESFSKTIKLVVLFIFLFSLLLTIGLSIYYLYTHFYLKKKAILNEQKKMGYYYQVHKQREEELLRKQQEELRKKKEVIITEEAKKLVGKTVVLEFKSSKIYGKISSLHGNKGVVRAIFRRGIPGQAIGMKVKILGV